MASLVLVTITSRSKVDIDFSGGGRLSPEQTEVRTKKIPLFVVDLVVANEGKEATFGFSSKPSAFIDSVLQYFDKSLSVVLKLTRIERRVMKNLFWSREPVMTTVHPSEDWVTSYRSQIESDMKRSAAVLDQYLLQFDPLLDFLKTDVEEYLDDIECKYGGKVPDDEEDADAEPKELDIDAIKDLSLKYLKMSSEVRCRRHH